jgi:hypothetical protein
VDYPKRLAAVGVADSSTMRVYATGHLVLWARRDMKLDLSRGLVSLTDPRIRHVAVANPKYAPYGRAAVAALRLAGLYDTLQQKLVTGESLAQAAQLVESGNADVGVLSRSLVLGSTLKVEGTYVDIRHRFIPRSSRPPSWSGVAGAGAGPRLRRVPRPRRRAPPSRALRLRAAPPLTMDWQALWLTARLAAVVSAILLVVSLPLAHWIVFSRKRWTFLVEAVVSLPLVLPPTVLGFYLLMAMGTRSPVGRLWSDWTGPSIGVHLRGAGRRLALLQPAVRGAAGGHRVQPDRPVVAGGVGDARRLAAAYVLSRRAADVVRKASWPARS